MGLPDEHKTFTQICGRQVEHKKIRDYLHFAQIIAGSKLLICNQTSGGWIAHGLGHPMIQETEMTRKIHDSIIARPGAQYYKGQELILP